MSGRLERETGGRSRPCLAVAYDEEAFSPLHIAEAAAGECDLLWVVDTTASSLGILGAMLSRFGTVVDLAGVPPDEAVDAVARHRPDGIVAFSDNRLAVAARLAESLGLRSNSVETVRRVLDKNEQRAALRAAGIAGPRFAAIAAGTSAAEIVSLTRELTFPVVLKPSSGNGSRDVVHLPDRAALLEVLTPGSGSGFEAEGHIVEEWLADSVPRSEQVFGDYVSVEGVVRSGEHTAVAVTGKFPLEAPYRETGNFLPSVLPEVEQDAVADLAARAVAALGIREGCVHTEIKLTPAGPRIVEANARVAGGGIDDLCRLALGISLTRLAIVAALGGDLQLPERAEHASVHYESFVQPPMSSRRLLELDGLEDVAALPGVRKVYVRRRPGAELDWHVGSQGYLLSVQGVVPDHEALQSVQASIRNNLHLEFEHAEEPEAGESQRAGERATRS